MRLLSLAVVGALLSLSSPSRADQPVTHDGFYLSFALGPGYLHDSVATSGAGDVRDVTSGTAASSQKTTVSGGTFAAQFLLGGTPIPGIVVGGGTLGTSVFSPTRNWNGNSRDLHAYGTGILGPFVDYWFDPHGGFHVQGMVGLADLLVNTSGTLHANFGAGFAIAGGHDWWVADSISIGLLVRATYSYFSFGGSSGAVGSSPTNTDLLGTSLVERHDVFGVAALFNFTYQ